ncbi:hypothetical protein ACQP00_35355 [Dactylosporangium sp. CS-047395]|uniref:hypothetical protein n=1 Tax=Dactylosporangium sp. CS-047395 TaxID=3239936 RepID=UPI003D8A6767
MTEGPADRPLDPHAVEPIRAELFIDLDDPSLPPQHPPAPSAAHRARPMMGRRTATARILVMLTLSLAVALPRATPPTPASQGRPVPLPSYCTGTPIPGGRLNIVQNDTFIILDATTGTIINSGRCPHGTGTRTNDGN